jgi:hypothetical protein
MSPPLASCCIPLEIPFENLEELSAMQIGMRQSEMGHLAGKFEQTLAPFIPVPVQPVRFVVLTVAVVWTRRIQGSPTPTPGNASLSNTAHFAGERGGACGFTFLSLRFAIES